MNAQIRALTKGDVTKEKEILALDTWRALTELNAQRYRTRRKAESLGGCGSEAEACLRECTDHARCSAMTNRRNAVKRCQCPHRHLSSAYRRLHGRPLSLSLATAITKMQKKCSVNRTEYRTFLLTLPLNFKTYYNGSFSTH